MQGGVGTTREETIPRQSDVTALDDPEVVEEADRICDHSIFGYDLGPVIDWRYNPTADSSRDPEWLWSLAQLLGNPGQGLCDDRTRALCA